MFPHEGSLYNWTHKALGGYWSFFIGFCAWFPGVLVIVAGADIVISLIAGLNSNWLTASWQQGLAIAAVIAFSGVLAVQRVRTVQNIVKVMVCLIRRSRRAYWLIQSLLAGDWSSLRHELR